MDDLDLRLLSLLRDDARLSMAALGRLVGLSRTATLARVRRLEEDGAITGYHAEVRLPETDATHVARVGITMRTADVAGFVRRLGVFPELTGAETVAGDFDLLVRFDAASAERLDAILDRINGWREVVRTTTFVVLRSYPV